MNRILIMNDKYNRIVQYGKHQLLLRNFRKQYVVREQVR